MIDARDSQAEVPESLHAATVVGSPSGAVKTMGMGLLAAVGGGIIADVMTGVTPQVLLGKRLYAAPAVVAATLFVVLNEMGETIVAKSGGKD